MLQSNGQHTTHHTSQTSFELRSVMLGVMQFNRMEEAGRGQKASFSAPAPLALQPKSQSNYFQHFRNLCAHSIYVSDAVTWIVPSFALGNRESFTYKINKSSLLPYFPPFKFLSTPNRFKMKSFPKNDACWCALASHADTLNNGFIGEPVWERPKLFNFGIKHILTMDINSIHLNPSI